MLTIDYKGLIATWNADRLEWESDNERFARMLNLDLPEELFQVDSPFWEGGSQAIALKQVQDIFWAELEILVNTPLPEPGETEGKLD